MVTAHSDVFNVLMRKHMAHLLTGISEYKHKMHCL